MRTLVVRLQGFTDSSDSALGLRKVANASHMIPSFCGSTCALGLG